MALLLMEPTLGTGNATGNGSLYMHTSLHQISYFGSWLSPLSPVGHSDPTSDPVIQIDTALITFGDTKVIDPATQVLAQFEELVVHGHAPVAVR